MNFPSFSFKGDGVAILSAAPMIIKSRHNFSDISPLIYKLNRNLYEIFCLIYNLFGHKYILKFKKVNYVILSKAKGIIHAR